MTYGIDFATGGPDTVTGSLGGSIIATATSGTVVAQFTDVDIDTNILDFTNKTGSVTLTVTPGSTINIDIPTQAFSSGLAGSMSITADDDATDSLLGIQGGLEAGNDGVWDDLDGNGELGNATLDSVTLSSTGPLSATANVTGSVNGVGSGNINLGTVLFQTMRLNVLNTSVASLILDPVQNVSIENLSISTSLSIPVNFPTTNFVEGTHPLDGNGFPDILDLSASGAGLVTTTVSGNLVAALTGRLNANLDLSVTWGSITLTTLNDAFDGDLSSGNLFDLSESIALSESIPFFITVLHSPTTNVDYDDIALMLRTGSLGIPITLDLNETTSIEFPSTPIEVLNLSTPSGTVRINDLDIRGNISGSVNVNLVGSAQISVDLIAQALEENALNVSAAVPEAGTMVLVGMTMMGMVVTQVTRRRRQG